MSTYGILFASFQEEWLLQGGEGFSASVSNSLSEGERRRTPWRVQAFFLRWFTVEERWRLLRSEERRVLRGGEGESSGSRLHDDPRSRILKS